MLSWSNTTASGASQTNQVGNAFVAGNVGGYFLFQPTAMNLSALAGGANLAVNVAERTSQTCYMRGFSENIRMQTNSATPWFHRRICFTSRGGSPFTQVASGDTPLQSSGNSVDTTNGQERLWFNAFVNAQGLTIAAQEGIIFKGAQNIDWNDPIVAPIDTARIDLKFDKTWLIKSGNQNGTILERKVWHPMNKNLVYDDDESGEQESSSYFSVDDKRGMGDFYILDIFQAGVGAGAGDLLSIIANSTLYWHER